MADKKVYTHLHLEPDLNRIRIARIYENLSKYLLCFYRLIHYTCYFTPNFPLFQTQYWAGNDCESIWFYSIPLSCCDKLFSVKWSIKIYQRDIMDKTNSILKKALLGLLMTVLISSGVNAKSRSDLSLMSIWSR